MNYNLVFFRDEIEIFIISLFETRSRFVHSISRASRRDRDLYLLYLVLRDEIENLLYQILNFEKGTRNKKGFLVIEREFSSLILTRFFEIENSCQCLSRGFRKCGTFWSCELFNGSYCWSKSDHVGKSRSVPKIVAVSFFLTPHFAFKKN